PFPLQAALPIYADCLEAGFAHTPGLRVVTGATPAEVSGLLNACIFDDDPCIFIENLPAYWQKGEAPADPGARIPLGQARTVRDGGDVTVITYGPQVAVA